MTNVQEDETLEQIELPRAKNSLQQLQVSSGGLQITIERMKSDRDDGLADAEDYKDRSPSPVFEQ